MVNTSYYIKFYEIYEVCFNLEILILSVSDTENHLFKVNNLLIQNNFSEIHLIHSISYRNMREYMQLNVFTSSISIDMSNMMRYNMNYLRLLLKWSTNFANKPHAKYVNVDYRASFIALISSKKLSLNVRVNGMLNRAH